MIDIFIKLTEKLIEFAREKQRLERSFHDDFLLPLVQQFESVHQEYIVSFQDYREKVTSESPNFSTKNKVFQQLESDMIYSHSSREKLMAMFEVLWSLAGKYHDNDANNVGRLIVILSDYIHSISDAAGDRYRNNPRGNLLRVLNDIASGHLLHEGRAPSQQAEREILNKMWEMQDLYARIQQAYQQAKTEMLK